MSKKYLIFVFLILFQPFSGFTNNEHTTIFENEMFTYIHSSLIGKIAVRIGLPIKSRYPEGAPVMVEAYSWFVEFQGFKYVNDTRKIGAITVNYLWPGRRDQKSGYQSDGEFDHGGPLSLVVLRDVIRFACGSIPNMDGIYIQDILGIDPLTDNVGLFASSHSGVVATNVIAHYGNEFPELKYFVGRENPTRDEMYSLEIGHFTDKHQPVYNLFYNENNYSPTKLNIDYSTVGWLPPTKDTQGRPYHAAKDTLDEHRMHPSIVAKMWGKRYYSRALTQALYDNGALTKETWPEDLATPEEAETYWSFRMTVYNYPLFITNAPNLKVMLVFAQSDHVQAAVQKPHIHQAWDGLHHTAGLWVRMNPDLAYMRSMDPDYTKANGFPDNPAQKEPNDWIYIQDWGFPSQSHVRNDTWLASVAEMADRVYANNWNADLDSVFHPVLIDTSKTKIDDAMIQISKNQCLLKNYPNPFNSQTIIYINLYQKSNIDLSIYDVNGRIIKSIFKGRKETGAHRFLWDALDLSTGIYYMRLRYGNHIKTHKCLLIK
jgi:hypothetical protein